MSLLLLHQRTNCQDAQYSNMSLLLKYVRPPEIRCHVRSPEQEDVSLLEGVQQECVCRCQHAQGPE